VKEILVLLWSFL